MSGGSMNYVCYNVAENADMLQDREMIALAKDFAKVLHDCEWYHSSDICHETYIDTVRKFKRKWFKGDRGERLRGYVDDIFAEAKEECLRMLEFEEQEAEE